MASPFVGEIRMFAGSFAPQGWNFCNGAIMSISQNEVLYQLLGTTYGGDGVNTFGLPDLRGRVPLHMGTGSVGTYAIGENGGIENVTLVQAQLGVHSHSMGASNTTATLAKAAAGNVLASTGPQGITTPVFQPFNGATQVGLGGQTLTAYGNGLPHENMQPYLCVSFIIALNGIFPSQN